MGDFWQQAQGRHQLVRYRYKTSRGDAAPARAESFLRPSMDRFVHVRCESHSASTPISGRYLGAISRLLAIWLSVCTRSYLKHHHRAYLRRRDVPWRFLARMGLLLLASVLQFFKHLRGGCVLGDPAFPSLEACKGHPALGARGEDVTVRSQPSSPCARTQGPGQSGAGPIVSKKLPGFHRGLQPPEKSKIHHSSRIP